MSDDERVMKPLGYGTAAPPDDGGHQGSFGRPEEELDVARHDGDKQPDLSYLPVEHRTVRRGSAQIVALLVITAIAFPILWSYCVR